MFKNGSAVRRREYRLYNVIFPVWMLFYVPLFWMISVPGNFLIDALTVIVACKVWKIGLEKSVLWKTIFRVFAFGYLSDFIGALFMFSPEFIPYAELDTAGRQMLNDFTTAVMIDPFRNLGALLWVLLCFLLSAFLIYFFNRRFVFRHLEIEEDRRKKLALTLAIVTAPYLFFLPTAWFF